MVADDIAHGYSASQVRWHVIVLRQILEAAVKDGRLGRNVAADVELPSEQARMMRFLTPDQLGTLAEAHATTTPRWC